MSDDVKPRIDLAKERALKPLSRRQKQLRVTMSVSTKISSIVARHCFNSDHSTKNNTNAPIHINKLPSLRTPNRHLPPNNNNDDKNTKPIKHLTRKKRCSTSDIMRLMDSLSHPIPPDMYTSLIKECTLTSDHTEALHLHSHLISQTNLKLTSPLIHRLLLMYLSCGQLDIAHNLFDKIPNNKDFISWVIIIVGCCNNSKYEVGIRMFIDMLLQHNVCDRFMFDSTSWVIVILCIIKACVYSTNMGLGQQLHGLLLKLGVSNESIISVSLMDFYGRFGCLEDANSVFSKLYNHNTATWTAKMVNSCRNKRFYEVIEDFKEMGKAGIKMNSFTFSSVLRACARIGDGGNCGKQVHGIAIKLELESDAFVQCGLIDMYGKCGMISHAKKVFELIVNIENSACWNALLMAYVRDGLFIEAIKLLYQMEAAKINVNESLINHVRIACSTEL